MNPWIDNSNCRRRVEIWRQASRVTDNLSWKKNPFSPGLTYQKRSNTKKVHDITQGKVGAMQITYA